MKCLKNRAALRFISLLFAAVLSAVFIASCESSKSGEESVSRITDTVSDTAPTEKSESKITEPNSSENTGDFDFENATVVQSVIGNIGETLTVDAVAEAAATEAAPVFSHPQIAEMRDGKIIARSAGVTLLGFEGGNTAFAVCVLPEGVYAEMNAGTTHLLELGDTYFIEGFASPDGYSVSDESVISLDGTTARAIGTGYAVVDASNASMPKLFAFLVFDRSCG